MPLSTLAHASRPSRLTETAGVRLPNLPWEIIVEIICRLPPKSLMRFRAVATLWRAVIDSPDFVKMHFNQSLKTQSHRSLILGFLGVFSIDLDKLDCARVLKPPFSSSDVSNSCNGLVLLLGQYQTPFLWNPSTKKYKTLPDSPVESPRPGFTVEGSYKRYGFGYIPEEDDYRVLRVVELRGLDTIWLGSEAKIYSLKSNSWTKVGSYPYPIPRVKGWGVHVNGACHTVLPLNEPAGQAILAVDLRGDRNYIVPKPDDLGKGLYELCVHAMAGCLCLIVARKKRKSDVWIMKEYGKKESWTKLLSIGPPDIEPYSTILLPLAYSNKGDEVLMNINDEKLIWYNLEKKTMREVQVSGLPFRFYAEAYVQTLIPLENGSDGGGVGVDQMVRMAQPVRQQELRKVKQIRNKRDTFLSQGFKLVL